ncbi:hypothetical protein, partial [Mesorhizobium sp.]|uniref:hypothetical protein n=1 Tax=Mesorhizobium sp. TaxID=1871066 RepID=UPI00257CBFAD
GEHGDQCRYLHHAMGHDLGKVALSNARSIANRSVTTLADRNKLSSRFVRSRPYRKLRLVSVI